MRNGPKTCLARQARLYTCGMAPASEPIPLPLSTVTVGHMIGLFERMYCAPTPLTPPMFDINGLSKILFAMGAVQEFISGCEYRYYWNFGALFPALYEGNFLSRPINGQWYLRAFAIIVCGAFAQHSELRTQLNNAFEQSLLRDGYRFDGRTLVEVDIDTSVVPELSELQNKESLVSDTAAQLKNRFTIALLFIDLDQFKQVNDQLSHDQGDQCLALIIRTVSAVLRNRGKLYRVGGDEFCALLPNFEVDEAVATAERIRRSIDALPPFGGKVKVTASIGIAASDQKQLSTADALLKAADEAMYVSKWTTKNRVCTWPPDKQDVAQAEANRKKAESAARV